MSYNFSCQHYLAPNKIQNRDILVPANLGPPGKWPLNRRERETSVLYTKGVCRKCSSFISGVKKNCYNINSGHRYNVAISYINRVGHMWLVKSLDLGQRHIIAASTACFRCTVVVRANAL